MGTESKYYQLIIKKLERLCKREYLQSALTGFQLSAVLILSVFTLFSLIELAGNLNSTARTILYYTGLALFASAVTYFFVFPLLEYFKILRKESYFKTAEKVGKHFPQIKDDLLNGMQLLTVEKSKKLYSPPLIDAAFKNIFERAKAIKFESIVDFKKTKKFLIYVFIAFIVAFGLFLTVPGLKAASVRLVNYNKEFTEPPEFTFNVSPGNLEITKGDNVFVSISTKGKTPKEILLGIKREDLPEYKFQKLIADSNGHFNYEITSVRTSFKYYATANEINSDEFKVKVIDRPIVKTLDVEINPPAYSRLEKIVQKDIGNVTSLVGTKVSLSISSTKILKKAYLDFGDSTEVDLKVNRNTASGNFRIKKDNTYKIKLLDKSDNENLSPITYKISAILDAYPAIEMIAPNKNIQLANDNRVNLIAKISDDFGFSNLKLYYRLSASRYEPPQKDFKTIEIPIDKNQTQYDVDYYWNLTDLNLAVDDVVSYYLEIFDNDNVSGPKSARTQIFTVRVPSLDEILADADQVQSQSESDLEQTLKEAKDLQNELKEIDQELKKDQKKLTWEEKEKIENALDKFEQLHKKVDDVSEKIKEMQNKLQDNDLLSKETLEKYMELQDMMDKMTSDEMKKALEKLRESLQQLDRQMAQQNMENMKFDEEMFKKSIERTLNLFKRIQIEQKVDELIKRTEELTKEQNELKEQTEKSDLSNKKNKNDLSKQQKDVSKKLDKLSEEMEKLDEKMNDMNDMPQADLEKMMAEFKKQQNQKKSENASQDIQKNQKQNAMQQQQQLSQNMSKLNQKLQQMKNSMMMQNQMQNFTDMMKILDNMLTLSKKQEDLKNENQRADPNSSNLKEQAQQQENLRQNLSNIMQQMSDLSQKTFAITPEMAKALGDANKSMQQAIQSMQNRNGDYASMTQGEAMKHLNEAASMLKGSMESMMQGGGKGGMMSLMQQLQQMAQQQMNVNNLTQMLQQMQNGQLTPQQQGELQRLSKQQDMIRKSMQQLNEEAKISGDSKKIPANLDEIAKQMYEVMTDMNTDKLDDKLIQKQERILSKLLDAQRSINERDFEKKRKSQTGKNIVRNSPNNSNIPLDENKQEVLDELKRAVNEGYVKDYEDLIIKYYEYLQKEEIKK